MKSPYISEVCVPFCFQPDLFSAGVWILNKLVCNTVDATEIPTFHYRSVLILLVGCNGLFYFPIRSVCCNSLRLCGKRHVGKGGETEDMERATSLLHSRIFAGAVPIRHTYAVIVPGTTTPLLIGIYSSENCGLSARLDPLVYRKSVLAATVRLGDESALLPKAPLSTF
jgi:hypothetical protein